MNDWIFAEVTREERYFASVLHHEMLNDIEPFSRMLCSRLHLHSDTRIRDFGYEVCFFRDWARIGRVKRYKELEKQTFDFMFRLSDGSLAIMEAKAQQGFATAQLDNLIKARAIIEKSKGLEISKVHLVALCSSKYGMKPQTKRVFNDVVLLWDRLDGNMGLTDIYPKSRGIFKRANDIYGL